MFCHNLKQAVYAQEPSSVEGELKSHYSIVKFSLPAVTPDVSYRHQGWHNQLLLGGNYVSPQGPVDLDRFFLQEMKSSLENGTVHLFYLILTYI